MDRKSNRIGLFLALILWCIMGAMPVYADAVPQPMSPPRLVNDLAGVLGSDAQRIEHVLRSYDDSTSNQITVVTVNDLGGYDPAMFAYEIGERWGVGNKKYNNGVVVLIKPKRGNEKGVAFIAPGYGLEPVLTDAVCNRIVNQVMIPHFKEEDYVGGVEAALELIMPLASGEISSKEFTSDSSSEVTWTLVGFLLVIVLAIVISRRRIQYEKYGGNDDDHYGGGGWIFFGPLMGGGNHRGSWGSFSSGGFGGFGGGSFGGGGSGGSW